MSTQTEDRLFTESEVAKRLRVSVWTVMRLRKSGRIAFHRRGRAPLYLESDVHAYIRSCREAATVVSLPRRSTR